MIYRVGCPIHTNRYLSGKGILAIDIHLQIVKKANHGVLKCSFSREFKVHLITIFFLSK